MFGSKKSGAAQARIESLIGPGTRVEGHIIFTGGLRVDGEVVGNVSAEGAGPATLVISEKAIIRGDVRVNNVEKQQSMKTEEMYFDQNKQIIYNDTTQLVRIQTPTEVLTGYGLTANQDFSRYTILKPEGVFTIDQAATQPAK